jgi:hypothetical protein
MAALTWRSSAVSQRHWSVVRPGTCPAAAARSMPSITSAVSSRQHTTTGVT